MSKYKETFRIDKLEYYEYLNTASYLAEEKVGHDNIFIAMEGNGSNGCEILDVHVSDRKYLSDLVRAAYRAGMRHHEFVNRFEKK